VLCIWFSSFWLFCSEIALLFSLQHGHMVLHAYQQWEGWCEITCSACVWTDVLKMWFALQIGGLWICRPFAQWLNQHSELTTECGLWDHSAKKRDGTSISMRILFAGKSLKIQKKRCYSLGQNRLLLKHGLQEISPQGTVLAKRFFLFVFFYSAPLICFFLHDLWDYSSHLQYFNIL